MGRTISGLMQVVFTSHQTCSPVEERQMGLTVLKVILHALVKFEIHRHPQLVALFPQLIRPEDGRNGDLTTDWMFNLNTPPTPHPSPKHTLYFCTWDV